MRLQSVLVASVLAATTGCDRDPGLQLPGNTEWDRIVVLAEASERILDWHVAEGDRVEAGDLLLRLDADRHDARIAEAANRLAEAEARLAELKSGPRPETIARARAERASAAAAQVEAELEYERVRELLARGLTSQSSLDQALATRDQRRAALEAADAVLAELLAGTRSEQIDQAEAHVSAIRAEIHGLGLTRERFEVRAPRSGRVDTLPFKPGDQPRAGDALASLLVGDAPFARVFVPASVRAGFSEGDVFEIGVEGVGELFRARLRSIRSEASFTPYYALTGDDASRLVYRAELLFEDARAAELPAGLPLVATPLVGTALVAAGADE
jgi:HlyD family secretion protein